MEHTSHAQSVPPKPNHGIEEQARIQALEQEVRSLKSSIAKLQQPIDRQPAAADGLPGEANAITEKPNAQPVAPTRNRMDSWFCALVLLAYIVLAFGLLYALIVEPVSDVSSTIDAAREAFKTGVNNATLAWLALAAAGGLIVQGLQLSWDRARLESWKMTLLISQWTAAVLAAIASVAQFVIIFVH